MWLLLQASSAVSSDTRNKSHPGNTIFAPEILLPGFLLWVCVLSNVSRVITYTIVPQLGCVVTRGCGKELRNISRTDATLPVFFRNMKGPPAIQHGAKFKNSYLLPQAVLSYSLRRFSSQQLVVVSLFK